MLPNILKCTGRFLPTPNKKFSSPNVSRARGEKPAYWPFKYFKLAPSIISMEEVKSLGLSLLGIKNSFTSK